MVFGGTGKNAYLKGFTAKKSSKINSPFKTNILKLISVSICLTILFQNMLAEENL